MEDSCVEEDYALRVGVQERLHALHASAGLLEPIERFRERVRKVVVIGSASRGGSSLFAEILRQSSQFIHLRGEFNPFLLLNGHTFPTSGTGSDALGRDFHCSEEALDAVGRDLALDCGEPITRLAKEEDLRKFSVDLACRLTLQWPGTTFELEHVARCVSESLRALERSQGWPAGHFVDAKLFHAVFLSHLHRVYPQVNPYCYDLAPDLLRRLDVPHSSTPGPPGPYLVEEPPFITITPWRQCTEEELQRRALVIKTPSNAYRLPYLERLFPNALICIVHLTRNPAASINGLIDGWLYAGFFSHRVPLPLRIAGYSDVFPAWGRRWWKFDLPPAWEPWASRRLEEVCAFQWRSAHRAILEHLDTRSGGPLARLCVRFEDVVGPPDRRIALFERLMRWMGREMDCNLAELLSGTLPLVMATEQPSPQRWRNRAAIIEPLLRENEIRDMAAQIGYNDDPSTWC